MVVVPRCHAGLPPLCSGLLALVWLGCAAIGSVQAATSTPASDAGGVKLEVADVVELSVVGRPELTTTIKVSEVGQLEVPLAGSIPVLGISLEAAAERVATAYREGEFFVDPDVRIALVVPRLPPISVGGEVVQPGRLAFVKDLTVKDAVARVGGLTPQAAEVAYILRFSGSEGIPVRIEVDLANPDFAAGSRNVVLLAGDRLEVLAAPRFTIQGAVRNPSAYALRRGVTVNLAIEAAGGLTERGSRKRVEIRRKDGSGRVRLIDAEIDDLVQANDVIEVKERRF
ncbi:MAG: SLBB domain-containing protein [Panacagrimonas sp.]